MPARPPFSAPRGRSLHAPAATVLALVLLAAPPAAAQAARETAVVDVSGDGKAAAEIAQTVRSAVEEFEGYVLKDIHGVLNAGGEAEAQSNIKTAQAFHKAGLAALEAGDAEDAAEQFESAARLVEGSFAHLRDPDEYRRLLLHLGVARYRSGEAAPAGLAFERAVLFRAEADMVELSRAERTLYDKAKQAVEARPLGAVMLRSQPEHAHVYVDGRYRGLTPLTAAGLSEGEHLITVYKTGYERQTAAVEVSSLGLVNRTVELAPARRKRLYEEMASKLRDDLEAVRAEGVERGGEGVRRMGALLFAEAGVVIRTTGKTPKHVELYLFDTNSRLLVNRVEGDVNWSRRNRDQLRDLVRQLLTVDWSEALAGDVEEQGPVAVPVTKKWWFWTAIGLGVAGAATAGVLIATSGDDGAAPSTGTLLLTF